MSCNVHTSLAVHCNSDVILIFFLYLSSNYYNDYFLFIFSFFIFLVFHCTPLFSLHFNFIISPLDFFLSSSTLTDPSYLPCPLADQSHHPSLLPFIFFFSLPPLAADPSPKLTHLCLHCQPISDPSRYLSFLWICVFFFFWFCVRDSL